MNKFFQRKHSLQTSALHKSKIALVCVIGFISLASSYACFAQGEIHSGEAPAGAIRPLGDVDTWTFSANRGDTVLIGIGRLSEDGGGAGSGFKPQIRAYRPDGTFVASAYGYAARVGFTASQLGNYIINVDDGGGYHDGTGTYQLFLFKAPGSFVVPALDDGGALTSGTHRNGTIQLGDLDLWSFVAYVGSSITLSIGKLTDDGVGGGFSPQIRVYRPDGSLYASHSGSTNAQVLINSADQSGTYTVVIDDAGVDGSGTYQLTYTRSLDPPRADFNADAKPDWVLQRPSTGQIAVWLEDNGTLLASGDAPSLPPGWTLLDADQFGGGANSADFLLFKPATRDVVIWYMNGATLLDSAVGPKPPAGWVVVLSQDFNGDAKPDLLLYQASTHRTVIWYLNGVQYIGGANGPTLPSGWIVVGAADFNHDERADLLLYQGSTRETAIWYLNGFQFLSGTYGPTLPTGWVVSAVDDFNRDGKPDLILTNASTHQSAIWYLNNNVLINGRLSHAIPAGWVVSGPK